VASIQAAQDLTPCPFFDEIDPAEVDLLLVTHFHMDHCGAVPYFLQKTTFAGRVFMTHPTKAVCKLLLHDSVKVGNDDGRMWDEADLVAAMQKIELVNYHQVLSHKGVRFWCYNAGHVLGAAMFMIEVGGVRVLYTGDFSRQPDRHLLGAETPTEPPHVLIVESTYGVMEHEPRELRELRFTSAVHAIVKRGGRCLIPVFALGRSQELLLILDAYWRDHPELHGVPIYYASGIAKRCMRIYQTYINMMNDQVRAAHAAGRNPWEFSFVRNLPSSHQFDDSQPMVVMASPGMLQQGLSRELFETWCADKRNGLVMPGYSVVGTLANHLLTEPKEIQTTSGDWVPVNLSITYISFSAHSDFAQTSEFVTSLRPRHVIHVHGGEEEMKRLQRALAKQYDPKEVEFLTPQNCQAVHLRFPGDKIARVIGSLAEDAPTHGTPVSAMLVLKENKYTLLDAADLHTATPLASTTVVLRPRFRFRRTADELLASVGRIFVVEPKSVKNTPTSSGEASLEAFDPTRPPTSRWRVHNLVTIEHSPSLGVVTLEWVADPLSDTIADAISALLLQLQANEISPSASALVKHQVCESTLVGGTKSEDCETGLPIGELDFTLRILADQFGTVEKLPRVEAHVEEQLGLEEKPQAHGWKVNVAGHPVLLYGTSLPFEKIECDSEYALLRIRDVLSRAQRAYRPVDK